MADNKDADSDAEGGKGKGKGEKAPAGPASPMKLVIVGAVALFVAVLGAQVAAPLLTKAIQGDGSHNEAPAAKEGEEVKGEGIELAAAEPGKEEKKEPAQYVGLDPPFVVSFDEEDGTRYVQLQLQAMARSEKTVEEIKKHAPALRNAVLFQLNGYKLEELTTLEGKEKLRTDLTKKANEALAKNGSEGQIEELYFTNFVIQ
jgi:flagellar protein FliL